MNALMVSEQELEIWEKDVGNVIEDLRPRIEQTAGLA